MALSADPKIVARLAGLDRHDARLVSAVDDIIGSLTVAGLAWRQRIPPKMVGVHPANRNGYGVSAIEVHALGAEIVRMGWSPAATAHAVCVEDSADRRIAEFSHRLSASTVGLGVPGAEIAKFGSISCSHTN